LLYSLFLSSYIPSIQYPKLTIKQAFTKLFDTYEKGSYDWQLPVIAPFYSILKIMLPLNPAARGCWAA
ncbi:hypothetical protein ABIB60_003238, partial [Hymenobacter sp. UYP22]